MGVGDSLRNDVIRVLFQPSLSSGECFESADSGASAFLLKTLHVSGEMVGLVAHFLS